MLDGSATPPDDFNFAFLICLPKGDGTKLPGQENMYEASDTRPLSVVDAANRIIASIFRIALERSVGSWISEWQRGFLQGRQMLGNVVDVAFAAQKISLKTKAGAIILFDFKAAFPSLSHDYMWDTLEAIGIPAQYVKAIKLLYAKNKHLIKVLGETFPSVTVRSGVRQGCPMSPILFALCADILLREVADTLRGDSVVRAFADDTAVVVENYITALPTLCRIFNEFHAISALSLNIDKTVLIPLWPRANEKNVRKLVRQHAPDWRDIAIQPHGKYLGFVIGPGAGNSSLRKPLQKYISRARAWASLHLGLYYNTYVYRTFISSVIGFVLQLEPFDQEVNDHFAAVLRVLAPGPGNWITPADLTHMKAAFYFPCEYDDPKWTSLAAKLRVVERVVPDAAAMAQELAHLKRTRRHLPFEHWHSRSYAQILADAEAECKKYGISREGIRKMTCSSFRGKSFQQVAEDLIKKRQSNYNPEARIRHKLERFRLSGPSGILPRRVLK